VNEQAGNAFGRALSRARDAFEGFVQRPAAFQLAGTAAVILLLSALLPWFDYGGIDDGDTNYLLGVEGTPGALTVAIGVAAIALLAGRRDGSTAASGALPALGMLAVLLVGAELIHSRDSDFQDLAWGIYVSGGAAVVLLLTGFALFGGSARESDRD
jgi:hypothetical protein